MSSDHVLLSKNFRSGPGARPKISGVSCTAPHLWATNGQPLRVTSLAWAMGLARQTVLCCL